MKNNRKFSKASLKLALPLTIVALFSTVRTQTADSKNTIGGYVIPKDPLQDNYCQKYDITQFHEIKKIETEYQAFFLKRVQDLREPFYNFAKANKWVKN